MNKEIQSVRGFHDIFGEELEKFKKVTKITRNILKTHCFEEIILPVVEYAELFHRSIGEVTDIVQKEMFTFQDRKGRMLALRPEGTAGVVRAFIQHNMYSLLPYVKLFYEGPMFRYERPQAGRYRQFHQIGAEIFGVESPDADAEIINIVFKILKALNINVSIEINSLGCIKCRPNYRDSLVNFLSQVEDKLCEVCKDRKERNPLRVLDCKIESCKTALREAPEVYNFLCEDCKAHYEGLKEILSYLNVPFKENPKLVRGLDYYNRTVFEAVSSEHGNTIIAGGRYDYLVKQLGGPDIPATGFAVGIERVALMLQDTSIEKTKKYLVIPFGDVKMFALKAAEILRNKGLCVELSYRKGGLKKQLEFANKLRFDYAVIIGEEELKEGVVTLKDLSTGEQKKLKPEEL